VGAVARAVDRQGDAAPEIERWRGVGIPVGPGADRHQRLRHSPIPPAPGGKLAADADRAARASSDAHNRRAPGRAFAGADLARDARPSGRHAYAVPKTRGRATL